MVRRRKGEPVPDVPATLSTGRSWHYLIVEVCPFCGVKHTHDGGGASTAPVYGEKLSHCHPAKERRFYKLVPEEASPC
jgi:hypothetical protein